MLDKIKSIKQKFGIVGNSNSLNHAIQVATQVAPTDMTVLITGESGTGKQLIAKSIHDLSKKNDKRFIILNMEFFNEFSLNSFIKQIKTYTSENIKSIDDLNGCSILIKNVVDSNDLQQKNFLN